MKDLIEKYRDGILGIKQFILEEARSKFLNKNLITLPPYLQSAVDLSYIHKDYSSLSEFIDFISENEIYPNMPPDFRIFNPLEITYPYSVDDKNLRLFSRTRRIFKISMNYGASMTGICYSTQEDPHYFSSIIDNRTFILEEKDVQPLMNAVTKIIDGNILERTVEVKTHNWIHFETNEFISTRRKHPFPQNSKKLAKFMRELETELFNFLRYNKICNCNN